MPNLWFADHLLRTRRKSRNDENDEDNSDSYKQGVDCWITAGLEIPDRKGSPWFLPICSDFPRFPLVCSESDLRSLFSGMPRFVPICSVELFSDQVRRNQNESGKPLPVEPLCNPVEPLCKSPTFSGLLLTRQDPKILMLGKWFI